MCIRDRRRRRANTKFYIFIGAVAVVAAVILFFIFNMQTAEVETGTIPFETEVAAIVVRDEQVVSAQNLSLIHISTGKEDGFSDWPFLYGYGRDRNVPRR